MKKNKNSFVIRFIFGMTFLMLACQTVMNAPLLIGSAPATNTVEPQTAAGLASPTPTSVDSARACKLPPYTFTNVGLGLPNPSFKLPSVGDVKTIVLFADFNDVPAVQTPQEIIAMLSPYAEDFYSTLSYGRMHWTLEPHFIWLRLSQPSEYYAEMVHSYVKDLEFIQEAVNLADADIDFSTADSVVVMIPTQASAITFGPAFGSAGPNEGYKADGRIFTTGVTSGADLYVWGYLWLNHESGHTMGLPDLYAYDYDTVNYDDQHRYVGGFSAMGQVIGVAPEYFAFERWQLGWLDDSQILCQNTEDQTTTLTSIETSGGMKAVIVPISNSKAVVVESRRPIGYDVGLVKSGALVYLVDTSIASGKGSLVVYPMLENDPYRNLSPLAPGESVTVENVTVQVVNSTAEQDTVRVIVTK